MLEYVLSYDSPEVSSRINALTVLLSHVISTDPRLCMTVKIKKSGLI